MHKPCKTLQSHLTLNTRSCLHTPGSYFSLTLEFRFNIRSGCFLHELSFFSIPLSLKQTRNGGTREKEDNDLKYTPRNSLCYNKDIINVSIEIWLPGGVLLQRKWNPGLTFPSADLFVYSYLLWSIPWQPLGQPFPSLWLPSNYSTIVTTFHLTLL